MPTLGAVRPRLRWGTRLNLSDIDSHRGQLYISNYRSGESMAISTVAKKDTLVVSVLSARTNFGKLLERVDDERGSLVIEKRGMPKAVLLSIRDYVKLAAPEPEVLRIIGEASERNGTDKLTSRQIDQIIKTTRAERKKR